MNLSSDTPTPTPPRQARLEDLSALVVLENQVFDYDQLKRSSFRKFILSTNDLWVYEEDHVILGYLLVLKRKGSLKARIYSLAIHPASRGKGLGRYLLDHALEQLGGFNTVSLEVKVDNEQAIKLYENLGFQKVAVVEKFYSDGQDAFLMEKLLKKGPKAPCLKS